MLNNKGLVIVCSVVSYKGIINTKDTINAIDNTSDALKYKVGTYDELRKLTKGTDYDVHHVAQAKGWENMVPGYVRKNGPAIIVPKYWHTRKIEDVGVVSRSLGGLHTPTKLLRRDITELRCVSRHTKLTIKKTI